MILTEARVTGDIPKIIYNRENLYAGDLCKYFYAMSNAKNVLAHYHNFRHMSHVLYLCYQACIFYRDRLTLKQRRNILIAAMFHDFDHMGRVGNDDLNIQLALRAFRRHVLPEDVDSIDEIEWMIKGTQFPHVVPVNTLSLGSQILRDADVCQVFNEAWIQQVLYGLGAEMNQSPAEMLAIQEVFLKNLKLNTDWARQEFGDNAILAKIQESRELLALFKG